MVQCNNLRGGALLSSVVLACKLKTSNPHTPKISRKSPPLANRKQRSQTFNQNNSSFFHSARCAWRHTDHPWKTQPLAAIQASHYSFILLASNLNLIHHIREVQAPWFMQLVPLHPIFKPLFIIIIFLDRLSSAFALSSMSSPLFWKLLSRMHVFAKHILRSISGKGD